MSLLSMNMSRILPPTSKTWNYAEQSKDQVSTDDRWFTLWLELSMSIPNVGITEIDSRVARQAFELGSLMGLMMHGADRKLFQSNSNSSHLIIAYSCSNIRSENFV